MSTVVRIPDDAQPMDLLVIDGDAERVYAAESLRGVNTGANTLLSFKAMRRVSDAEPDRGKS